MNANTNAAEQRDELEYLLTCKLKELDDAELALYRVELKAAKQRTILLEGKLRGYNQNVLDLMNAAVAQYKAEAKVAKKKVSMLRYEADTMDIA